MLFSPWGLPDSRRSWPGVRRSLRAAPIPVGLGLAGRCPALRTIDTSSNSCPSYIHDVFLLFCYIQIINNYRNNKSYYNTIFYCHSNGIWYMDGMHMGFSESTCVLLIFIPFQNEK